MSGYRGAVPSTVNCVLAPTEQRSGPESPFNWYRRARPQPSIPTSRTLRFTIRARGLWLLEEPTRPEALALAKPGGFTTLD
jgi:hypothetical protein